MYKTPTGNWYTQSLFWEMWSQLAPKNRHCTPVFSFHNDRPNLINCKKTFVEVGDPTGYDWAMKYLESYDHWLFLMKRQWFVDEVETWTNELNAKLRAQAIRRITELASSNNEAQALAASKYLAAKEWDKPRAGRPSKEALKGEMRKLAEAAEHTADDAERIGLTVITGGKS